MAFIHYLFLGHFEHDGNGVRFSKSADDHVYRPMVRRPIDPQAIKAVLRETTGATSNDLTFPDSWMIGMDDGYLVCDKYTRDRAAIDFVARLVERTRCDIYDVGDHCEITLHDWLTATHDFAKP
jgi:hypothetical protein